MWNRIKKLKVGNITWIDAVDIDNEKKLEIVKPYNFHELDVEAILEENQFPRVNRWKDYVFVIMHFPKYIKNTKTYVINEFNVFVWKDFIITFRDYPSSHVDKIFQAYANREIKEDEKINPGYILYEILQVMLEKMFKLIHNLTRDLRELETEIFENPSADEAKTILIKKRNIVLLKNMFKPQVVLLRHLEHEMNEFFKWEYELYFEDLEDKIDFIINQLVILSERIDTIEDAFKNIVDLRLNKLMAILTIFSAFMLPLTLITSFYWMNLTTLPYADKPNVVYWMLIVCTIFMLVWVWYLKKKKII